MLVKKSYFLVFFLFFIVGNVSQLCLSAAAPVSQEEKMRKKALEMSKNLDAAFESRKNILEEHAQKLYDFEDSFNQLLKQMNVEQFFLPYKEKIQQWLKTQQPSEKYINDIQMALNTICLAENVQFVYANEQLSQALIYLAKLRSSDPLTHEQEIIDLVTSIKALDGIPEGITDESFFQFFLIFREIIAAQDQEKMLAFFAGIENISKEAVKSFCVTLALVMPNMDGEMLASAKLLVSFYQARVEENDYKIIYPIILKLKPLLIALKTDLALLQLMFTEQEQVLEASLEKTVEIETQAKAYRALIIQLKKYHETIKNFDEIQMHFTKSDWKQIDRSSQFFYYTSQAYDLFTDFFNLYRSDCWDKDYKGTCKGFLDAEWRKKLLFPWVMNAAFFAANSAMHYNLMRSQMSKEAVKPFVMGEGDCREKKKAFIGYFGGKVPALEGQIRLPAAKALKVNAVLEVIKSVGMQKLHGFTSSSQKLSSIGMMLGGSSYASYQTKKLIVDALYYHTVHQKFIRVDGSSHAGLTSYEPWVTDVLNTVSWGSIRLSDEIESLLYQTLSINSLDNLENFSLGIVTPDLVSKLVKIGKDGFLSSRGMKPVFDKVAKFNHKIIYGSDFHNKFKDSSDGLLFAAYADRELFSYGVGCIAKFVGGHVIKSCSGVLLSAARKVAECIVGKKTVAEYAKGGEAFQLVLTQGLAVVLGGPGSAAYEDCQDLLEIIKDMNPEWVGMAQMFLSMVGQGRGFLLSAFGLREIPGEQDKVNGELLRNIIYKIFVFNPINVRILSGKEISLVISTFIKDPKDTEAVAKKLIYFVQRNAIGKLGGALCGKLAEWRARSYWDKRGKPFVFGRSIVPA